MSSSGSSLKSWSNLVKFSKPQSASEKTLLKQVGVTLVVVGSKHVLSRVKQVYNSRFHAVTMSASQLPRRCTKVYLWLSVLGIRLLCQQVKIQYNIVPQEESINPNKTVPKEISIAVYFSLKLVLP